MLEVVIVYFLCKSVGDILRKKNRAPLPLQILTAVCWVGGEITGGIVWVVMQALSGQPPKELDLTVYLFCLVGAAAGAGFCFLIATLIAAAQPQQAFYGYGSGPNFQGLPPSGNPYNPYDATTPPQSPQNPFGDRQ